MRRPSRSALRDHARRDPELVRDAPTVLVRLLDAIIDRLADEIEHVSGEIEADLRADFPASSRTSGASRLTKLTALLTRIGRTQTLLTKIRYTAVSTIRMLSFLGGSNRAARRRAATELRNHVDQPDHRRHLAQRACSFLADNLTFLLDASLGLISIEQNAAMKLFSWAAVIFLPPTLIAGIFGMNFHHMPELNWHYGYPMSLVLMLVECRRPLSLLQEARLDLGDFERDRGRVFRNGFSCGGQPARRLASAA